MLTLENVLISLGDFNLSAALSIPDDARIAVIGPSGAGKSSLLNAIAGFLPIARGRITWNGTDITTASPGDRPVAMLFQDNNLFPHLSITQNVGLGVRPDLKLDASQRDRVNDALKRVGLDGLGARKPADLSGGQQSRAALARIFVQHRPLVLLDEPFSALGPALKAEMLDLLADVLDETGATLLMVTHDPQDARRIAPRTILVAEGRVSEPRDTGALLDDPPAVLRAYLG